MLRHALCGLLLVAALSAALEKAEDFSVVPLDGPICDLGEGPHFQDSTSTLYYVDLTGFALHRQNLKTGAHAKIQLKEVVSIVIPVASHPDQLITTLRNRLIKLDWNHPTNQTVLATARPDLGSGLRFNDGKIDPSGRLWIGTMLESPKGIVAGGGELFKYEGGKLISMSGNYSIPNGMAWNKNATVMFFNDSEGRKTYTFDFNLTAGTLSNRRVLVDYTKHPTLFKHDEVPDGMSIDNEGKIWIAMYNGHRVIRLDPVTGELLASVPVPAPQTTSIAFGGANFGELYVTTGDNSVKHDPKLKAQYPIAGKVFKVMRKATAGPALHGLKGVEFKA